jgi:hypothetical protein
MAIAVAFPRTGYQESNSISPEIALFSSRWQTTAV